MMGEVIPALQSMGPEDKARLRRAAFEVMRVYPGPPGKVLNKFILEWEEFGYRFGEHALTRDLVDHVLDIVDHKNVSENIA